MELQREKTGICAGIAAGGIIFVLFGLIPGSFLGGAAGLKLAGAVFGLPLGPGLFPRIMILTGMVFGLLISAVAIMVLSSSAGKLIGLFLRRPAGNRTGDIAAEKVRIKK